MQGLVLFFFKIKKILKKIKNNIKGFFCRVVYFALNLRSNKQQVKDLFNNKRVVIIGPAEEINKDLRSKILESDICIVIKNLYTVINPKSSIFANTRVILAHTLRTPDRGYLRQNDLIENNYYEILFPISSGAFNCDAMRFSFLKKSSIKLFRASSKDYSKIKSSIGGFIPTVGYATILLTYLQSPKSVHIHGITFFQNNGPFHVDGYIQSDIPYQDLLNHVAKVGNHSIEREFKSFLKLASEDQVSTSGKLKEIINQSRLN